MFMLKVENYTTKPRKLEENEYSEHMCCASDGKFAEPCTSYNPNYSPDEWRKIRKAELDRQWGKAVKDGCLIDLRSEKQYGIDETGALDGESGTPRYMDKFGQYKEVSDYAK